MTTHVKDIMSTHVVSVSPQMGLDVLEYALNHHAISGAPVIDSGKLVGVVSQTDIINQLAIEHTYASSICDYHEGPYTEESRRDEILQMGTFVGHRMENLTVKDIMKDVIETISPDASVEEAANQMIKDNIHRLLVVDDDIVGILSSTDFVRLCSEGHTTH